MNAKFDGKEYRITRSASIYTSRGGKDDCRIMVESDCEHGGSRHCGKLFRTIAVYASESGDTIRSYESLPAEITEEILRQWAMLDASALLAA